jgi:hypothetical protein
MSTNSVLIRNAVKIKTYGWTAVSHSGKNTARGILSMSDSIVGPFAGPHPLGSTELSQHTDSVEWLT